MQEDKKGYVKLYRKIEDWKYFRDHMCFRFSSSASCIVSMSRRTIQSQNFVQGPLKRQKKRCAIYSVSAEINYTNV